MIEESMDEYVIQEHTCAICLTAYYKPVQLAICKHVFCESCIQESSSVAPNMKCPLCRAEVNVKDIKSMDKLWAQLQAYYPKTIQDKKKYIREKFLLNFLIGNRTEVIQADPGSQNKYSWTLFLKPLQGEKHLSQTIKQVQVQLHPTFHPSKIKFDLNGGKIVEVKRVGWGTFTIDVKIFWKDQFIEKETTISHTLQFIQLSQKIAHIYLTLKS